jgi:predicted permease
VLSEVGPDYFATLGIPIVAGREFTAQDVGPAKYAVINESFAREYLPGRNPIGLRFGLVNDMEPASPDTEVIGVIPDRKYRDLRETPPAQAYFPYLEGVHFRFMNIYLRTQADPRQVEDELLERMRQFDPHVPVVGLQTMNEQIGISLRTERLVASLSGVFGGLATLLAVIGLYGVMAYVVMRRTREIGIRIALGASRSNVIAMVMREVFLLIGAGLATGIALALALADLIRSQIYGLNPRDPLTFIGSVIVRTVAAGLAGFIPALRASAVDPTTALRQE